MTEHQPGSGPLAAEQTDQSEQSEPAPPARSTDPGDRVDQADQAEAMGPVPETDWRRLDGRMLLVNPLETLIRALPAVLAIFVARAGSDSGQRWELIAVPVILAFGALRWLTTRYRIQDGQIELRRGVITKQVTTARLDKVRTVDLTSKIYHRVLGLAKVEISTGSSAKERLVLDSLRVGQGRTLRAELLHRRGPAVAGLPGPTGAPVDASEVGLPASDASRLDDAGEVGDVELLRLDPGWVRYAPLTLTGLVSTVAIFGFVSQGLRTFGDEGKLLKSGVDSVGALTWWVDALLLVIVVSVLAVFAYVLSFWGFRLTRSHRGSLHTRRGLLTSRETSIDHARVRGIRLDEPIGLRLAGGRRLKVVTTGLRAERGGSDWLCPPAPADVVTDLARTIVPDDDAVFGRLHQHGGAARRRRLARALVPTSLLVLVVATAILRWDGPLTLLIALPPLPVIAVVVALDRYRGLGHRVTPDYLVTRQGSLDRRRVVLARSGVIGWTVVQSFFQRRSGVATLVATTAAGQQHYDVFDVPLERAYAIIAEISPDLLAQFQTPERAFDTSERPQVPDAQ